MTSDANVLKPGEQIKAVLSINDAKELMELKYGFTVKSIKELDAYDDLNYFVTCDEQFSNPNVTSISKHGYVMKVVNKLDSQKPGFIEAQNELLLFLSKKGFICPVPVCQKGGSYFSTEPIGKNGEKHVLRLLIFQPGQVLDDVSTNEKLMKSVGLFMAKLDKNLEDFWHPAYSTQTSLWVLPATPKLQDFLFALDNEKDVNFIKDIISQFELKVLSIIDSLDKGIIHGDLNENNIIVSDDESDIVAIIDFGDSYKSCYIFELAICLCYMITKSNSIDVAKYVIEGYQEIRQLSQQEKNILKLCVCARLAQSLVLGSYSYQREPENHYLIRKHEVKWRLLKKLWSMTDNEIMTVWGL